MEYGLSSRSGSVGNGRQSGLTRGSPPKPPPTENWDDDLDETPGVGTTMLHAVLLAVGLVITVVAAGIVWLLAGLTPTFAVAVAAIVFLVILGVRHCW